MRNFLLLSILGATLTTAGASDLKPESIRNAEGETQVRFVYCIISTNKCRVIARFDDMDSCGLFWRFYNSYCDSVSTPGQINCRREDSPDKGVLWDNFCVP